MHAVLAFWDFAIIALLCSACGGLGVGFASRRGDDDLAQRNARKLDLIIQARKLDLIIQHLGIAVDPISRPGLLTAEVRAWADHGKVVEAIKRYRQETGTSLKESRDVVDEYKSRLRQ